MRESVLTTWPISNCFCGSPPNSVHPLEAVPVARDPVHHQHILLAIELDLAITDLVMPRLNGVELTKLIRQELPHPKVILMSSFTEDAYRLVASNGGAGAFGQRRVIYDALVPAIRDLRRISGGSDPIPPSVGRLRRATAVPDDAPPARAARSGCGT